MADVADSGIDWKLACVLEAIYARCAGGAGGGDRTDMRYLAGQVTQLAEAAAQAAARLG